MTKKKNNNINKKSNSHSEHENQFDSSENFNSDYYFDDIIKELGEAGFYTETEDFNSEDEPQILKKQEVFSNNNIKEELFGKLNLVEKNLDSKINSLREKVKSFTNLVIKDKNDSKKTRKDLQNNLILSQNDNNENFNKLLELFSDRIAEDTVKEKAFEELYSQLDSYKKNFVDITIKPFLHDLILLYDRMNNNIKHFTDTPQKGEGKVSEQEEQETNLLAIMEMYKEELLEIFSRNGIEKIEGTQPGDKFNPEKSNAIRKEQHKDEALDNTIKEVIQEGFIRHGKILRPENVIIYKK